MRVFGWLGFVVLVAATGAMAGSYAWSVGLSHGPPWAWIAAAGAASLLVVEAMLAAGRGSGEPWLRWPALVLALLAVASLEVGFASSVFSDARATRDSDAKRAARAAVATEPAAVLRVRLEAIEAQHKGVSAAWCSAKSAGSRAACERWLGAREALAAAEDAERHEGARPVGDADARAALLARLLGGREAVWADALVLLLAAAMSFARVAAASMLLGRPVAARTPRVEASPAPVEASPAPVEASPAPVSLTEPAQRVLRVVSAKAQPAPEGRGYVGLVPPGELSQRGIAEAAGMSRRAATTSLQQLEAAGVVQVRVVGRDGTEFRLLRAAG